MNGGSFVLPSIQSLCHVGAISWAVVNLMIGPITDSVGFISFYPFAMVVTVVFFISIAVYVEGQDNPREVVPNNDSFGNEIPTGKSTTNDHHLKELPPRVPIRTLLCILAGTIYGASVLFAVVCLSSGMSVVESLVFLFFEFLGGSNAMCGMTVALTVMFEIPIFHVAPMLLRRLGAGSLLLIAGVSYIVRVIGYTLVPKGHIALVLLLEPLHGVTFACAQTSTVDFAAHVMPKGSEASGQGLLGVFKGVGSVAGLFLGGLLQETLGPRIMYRIFATTVALGMLVLSVATWRQPERTVALRHDVLPQSDSNLSPAETNASEGSSAAEIELSTNEMR